MQRGDSEIGAASFIDYLNAIMTCFSLGVANYALIKLLADELLAVLYKDTFGVKVNRDDFLITLYKSIKQKKK